MTNYKNHTCVKIEKINDKSKKGRGMKKLHITILSGLLSIIPLTVSADDLGRGKHNFLEILASKVAEFIKPATYDYRDYGFSGTSKIFALTGNFCGDTETRTISRTTAGENTEITMSRVRTSIGVTCHNKTFTRLATPTEMLLIDKGNNTLSGVLKSTDTLDGPMPLRTSTMEIGSAFGSASNIIRTPVGGLGVLSDLMVNTTTLLAVEDVTVPAGSYTACLKIHTLRTSATFGRFNRVQWFCPAVGEVKRMQSESLGETGFRIWKLTSMN